MCIIITDVVSMYTFTATTNVEHMRLRKEIHVKLRTIMLPSLNYCIIILKCLCQFLTKFIFVFIPMELQ